MKPCLYTGGLISRGPKLCPLLESGKLTLPVAYEELEEDLHIVSVVVCNLE